MKHKHLNRIAYPTHRVDKLYFEFLKPLKCEQDETLLKNFLNALIHHDLIKMFFGENNEDRYYITRIGSTFQGRETMKFIAKCLAEGIPFENITPQSHTHTIITDFDFADMSKVEDVCFVRNDSGRILGIYVDGINVEPLVKCYYDRKDLETKLNDIKDSQVMADRVNLKTQSLKQGE